MSDMPPKKKRPRVAGQPRPGANKAAGSSSASAKPVAGASRRAPIQKLGSSASPEKVAKTSLRKPGTSTKSTKSTKVVTTRVTTKTALTGSGGSGAGVAKSAPSRSGSAQSASSRGPFIVGTIGALALLIGLLGLWHPGGASGQDKSFVDASATSEVLGQMETAACGILGPRRGESVDKWIANSRAALVGEARNQWEKFVGASKDVIEQTQRTVDCRVDAIGVRALTGSTNGSTAQVLTALVISNNQGAALAGSLTSNLQLQVVRDDDRWKITKVDNWG